MTRILSLLVGYAALKVKRKQTMVFISVLSSLKDVTLSSVSLILKSVASWSSAFHHRINKTPPLPRHGIGRNRSGDCWRQRSTCAGNRFVVARCPAEPYRTLNETEIDPDPGLPNVCRTGNFEPSRLADEKWTAAV